MSTAGALRQWHVASYGGAFGAFMPGKSIYWPVFPGA